MAALVETLANDACKPRSFEARSRGRWARGVASTRLPGAELSASMDEQARESQPHLLPGIGEPSETSASCTSASPSSGGGWRRRRATGDDQASVQDCVAPLTREGPPRPGLGCTIQLRRGLKIPQMGLGGGSLDGQPGRDAVAAALLHGYRLIDTALYYGNEADIAAGIKLAGVPRSDVFITTKLLQKAHASDAQVERSLRESLRNLGSSYVDLYLVHNPRAGRIKQVWPLLQRFREEGLIRAIGVSNFGVGQLEGMRNEGLELPEVNQIEVHCWRHLLEVVAYHRQHGIATMCMAPLARCQLFGKTDLSTIARELGRSEAEVAVRWCLQQGYIPIPKSIDPARIRANAAEGFDLSQKLMARIAKLDTGYMSCKVASPCHELPWHLLADAVPDPSLWQPKGRGKKGSGKHGGAF